MVAHSQDRVAAVPMCGVLCPAGVPAKALRREGAWHDGARQACRTGWKVQLVVLAEETDRQASKAGRA